MKITRFEYKPFSSIDINDKFFDSLKHSYSEFESWFTKKAKEGRKAYTFYSEQNLVGFLSLKIENENEDYQNVIKSFSCDKRKRIKISTFKVISTQKRIGEEFIEIIHRFAIENKIPFIYLTLFENDQTRPLIKQLQEWGFAKTDKNNRGEDVFCKTIKYSVDSPVKFNYPLNIQGIKQKSKIYWLPITSRFHHILIADAASSKKLDKDQFDDLPSTYTIEKNYISNIPLFKLKDVKQGDILLIYRIGETTPKRYSSILTGYGVLKEWKDLSGYSVDDYLKILSNRTVFSKDDLIEIKNSVANPKLISFLFINKLIDKQNKYITLDKLQNIGVIEKGSGPRPLDEVPKHYFDKIISLLK